MSQTHKLEKQCLICNQIILLSNIFLWHLLVMNRIPTCLNWNCHWLSAAFYPWISDLCSCSSWLPALFHNPLNCFTLLTPSFIHFTASSLYLPTTLFSFITSRLPLLFFTHGLNALPHLYLRPDLFDLWLYAFSFPVYSSFSPARLHYCRLENRRTHITFLYSNVSIPWSHYVKVMFAATPPPMITP